VDLLASLLEFREGVPSTASLQVATALVCHLLPCRLAFERLAVRLVKDSGATPPLPPPPPFLVLSGLQGDLLSFRMKSQPVCGF